MKYSEEILLSLKNGVRMIKFNRPNKKNAINESMVNIITNVLKEDGDNDNVVITIITGIGDYYSSGNDLTSSFKKILYAENPEIIIKTGMETMKLMLNTFINYPKIIISVVNGPAMGIAATLLGICDIVYASDKAWFETPFVKIGLCTEGCSSYTYSRILGTSKASEVLLLGKRMSAQEAYDFNLVAQIIPHEKLEQFIESLYKYGKLPAEKVKISKQLINCHVKNIMCDICHREVDQLMECIKTEEFVNSVMAMMSKKHKL